ncbi:hypothetical protein V6N13_057819 [Hibiscus sabdariffa]
MVQGGAEGIKDKCHGSISTGIEQVVQDKKPEIFQRADTEASCRVMKPTTCTIHACVSVKGGKKGSKAEPYLENQEVDEGRLGSEILNEWFGTILKFCNLGYFSKPHEAHSALCNLYMPLVKVSKFRGLGGMYTESGEVVLARLGSV